VKGADSYIDYLIERGIFKPYGKLSDLISKRAAQEGRREGTNLPQPQCQTNIRAKAKQTNARELASTYRTPWFITPPLASVGVRKIVIENLLSGAAAYA
jgi:hypothetical protein